MTTLTTFKQAEQLSLDAVLATTRNPGRNNGHDCEVEALCHERTGVNQYRFSVRDRRYVCGWRTAGTVVQGCRKRRKILAEM